MTENAALDLTSPEVADQIRQYLIAERLCVYPGCVDAERRDRIEPWGIRRPRPALVSPGAGQPGRYCNERDGTGPLHTAASAHRARRGISEATRAADVALAPVTSGVITASKVIDNARALAAQLVDQVQLAVSELQNLADVEAVEAEIETARAVNATQLAEATAKATTEHQARVKADRARDAAVESADEMAGQIDELDAGLQAARDALGEKDNQLGQLRGELAQAEQLAIQQAGQLLEAATAQERLNAELRTVSEERDLRIRERDERAGERDRQRERADQLDKRLTAETAALTQLRETHQNTTEELRQARGDLQRETVARTDAEARATRLDTDLATARRQLEEETAKLTALRGENEATAAQLREALRERDQARSAVERETAGREEAQQRAARLDTDLTAARRQTDDAIAKLEAIRTEQTAAAAQLREALGERDQARGALQLATQRAEDREQQLTEARADVTRIRGEAATATSTVASLTNQVATLTQQMATLTAQTAPAEPEDGGRRSKK